MSFSSTNIDFAIFCKVFFKLSESFSKTIQEYLLEGFIKVTWFAHRMPVIKKIIEEIDRCVKDSQKLFEQEFEASRREREYRKGKEPIMFTTSGNAEGLCLSCNKEKVNYSIRASWKEGITEGLAEVNWTCKNCKRKFTYNGRRGKVIGQLGDITPPLAA